MHYLLTVPSFEDGAEHPTSMEDAQANAVAAAKNAFNDKLTGLAEFGDRLLSLVMLNVLDEKWKDHLYDLDQLRNAIHYRSWGQKDPLIEYKHEAYTMFVDLMNDVYHTFTERFLRAQISFGGPPTDFAGDGESVGGDGQGQAAPAARASRPTQRYNEFGLLEDIPELATNGAEIEEEVVEIGPAEPPAKKKAARPEPIVTGAGRVRSLNPVARAGVPGVSPSAVAADWTNVGRNDPCPCGSGKKFKKCHGVNQ
jgi:preprotein translocase subunit SecA